MIQHFFIEFLHDFDECNQYFCTHKINETPNTYPNRFDGKHWLCAGAGAGAGGVQIFCYLNTINQLHATLPILIAEKLIRKNLKTKIYALKSKTVFF